MMDRKGAVGLVVGIVMFAMVASVAMGIDFSRTYLTRVRLQTAIDAAALTAGREVKASTRDADATLVFWQNFAVNHVANGIGPLGSQTPGPKITFVDASTLNISATAYVPMVFAKIFGWNQIPVVAQAQVVAAGGGLEVALVLDNTNSLGSDGILALRTGATNLVETVYGDSTTTTTTWVSVVPFGGEVNIGNSHTDWLDSSSNISTLKYGKNGWGGCVFARYASDGTADMSENPPVSSYLFKPFFWPTTYQKTPYYCSWFGGCSYLQGDNDWSVSGRPGITETAPITLSASAPPRVSSGEVGPNLGCPPLALLPETAAKATVEKEISLMPMLQRGGTLIQNALQMGWFTISPKWKGLWSSSLPDMPYDYGQSSTKKILVLMTDGTNQMCPCYYGYPDYYDNMGGWWNSDETAFGRLLDNNLATVNGYYYGFQDTVRPILDNLVVQVCSNMKAMGIDLFVILYTHQGSSVDTAAINTMKACATDSNHYFESPNASDMQTAFSNIAGQISALRLSQ
ncbi:MAG: pilus assembly protein TadG-related protein [Acetobacter fabarum]|uniref:Tad domain-containing protein n=1 Tax=Acetobacter TaxID=434 RepID=UPI0013023409|nr:MULTISPECIES: TadE/TadG family type IV pilus assembly protein [Acetobacter]MCH4025517.1 pilus assembly protein TadG-related protein [Acetobacter fabarum]MCH4055822.1 pilus assembly protein TadG-related protein [Acetobacter fabarum]MCH4086623.1 pilus assembly protein TadG-related protein [Acetobacter fabarum]MCH4128136.1 pilus assembly protein TadG-related protein [Acetobacter fabarum]MCH4138497.1 pilus assembly protein TadG-related protein [Acetobacter fabarum]